MSRSAAVAPDSARTQARTRRRPRADVAGAHSVELLRQMLRIRRFEERCVQLYSAAKIRGFLHLYIGEEAVAVGDRSGR